jgi:lysophospholipase L1-like esterase
MATPAITSTSRRASSKRRILRLLAGPIIALTTVAIMLLFGEVYFRYFVLKSDSHLFTLMARRWEQVCWNPLFTLFSDKYPNGYIQYRDRTWTDADVQGKKKIMIVGDSFAAGHGICNARDRFGDVLQSRLGDGYAVFNVAVNGWGTPEETYFPLLYPYKPDVVVLSYYVNDIRNAITLTHHDYPEMIPRPDWLVKTKLGQSYLIDFVYWQIIYKFQYAENSAKLWQALLDSYFVPDIWAEHKSEIMQVIAWAKQNNTPLIVIVWPTLESIDSSAKQTAMVEQLFRDNGVTVISGTDMFRGDAPQSLVVNNIDSHPNENTHRRIADALYNVIQTLPK